MRYSIIMNIPERNKRTKRKLEMTNSNGNANNFFFTLIYFSHVLVKDVVLILLNQEIYLSSETVFMSCIYIKIVPFFKKTS